MCNGKTKILISLEYRGVNIEKASKVGRDCYIVKRENSPVTHEFDTLESAHAFIDAWMSMRFLFGRSTDIGGLQASEGFGLTEEEMDARLESVCSVAA